MMTVTSQPLRIIIFCGERKKREEIKYEKGNVFIKGRK